MSESNELRRIDASNRAVRTLMQNFVADIALTVLLALGAAFDSVSGFEEIPWGLVFFSIVKSLLLTVIAYVQRMQTTFLAPPVAASAPRSGASTAPLMSNYSGPVAVPDPAPGMEPYDTEATLRRIAEMSTEEEASTFTLAPDYTGAVDEE